MRYIRVFSELSNDIKFASQKRILLEMAIIRLCKPSMENDLESIVDRVRQIEEKIANGVFTTQVADASSGEQVSVSTVNQKPQKKKAELPKAISDDVKKVPALWPKIVTKIDDEFVRSMVTSVNFTAREDNKLTIVMLNDTTATILNNDGSKQKINELIDTEIGAHVEIEIIGQPDGERFSDTFTDLRSLSQMLNFDIEEEEDNG